MSVFRFPVGSGLPHYPGARAGFLDVEVYQNKLTGLGYIMPHPNAEPGPLVGFPQEEDIVRYLESLALPPHFLEHFASTPVGTWPGGPYYSVIIDGVPGNDPYRTWDVYEE